MNCEGATEPHGKLLRAWQLAILRFAVTLDDDDRMHALALAGEVDRLGEWTGGHGSFHFFRRTTAELCRAICGHDEDAEAVVRCFLVKIKDARLKRALEAAIAKGGTRPTIVGGRTKASENLWKGLSPRRAVRG